MFGRFEKLSINTNKTIVIMHLVIMTIVFVVLKITCFELMNDIRENGRIDVVYLMEFVFKYNIGVTCLVLFMVGVVILGYCFYIKQRKKLISVMYEQGPFKVDATYLSGG